MSAIGNLGKRSIRSVKNYAKRYSVTQTKVRNATSNDPWPATQRQLEELTQLSYRIDDFEEIVEILEKRLNDNGKNWRHVQKSLTLIEHLLQQGPERVVHYCKNHFHAIRTLKDFQYRDERGNDHGAGVRQKAKDVSNLLTNPSTLRYKRRARSVMDTSFLLSLGNTADVDDEENENVRRRDVALLRASFVDQTEDPPVRTTRRPGGGPKSSIRPMSSLELGGALEEGPSRRKPRPSNLLPISDSEAESPLDDTPMTVPVIGPRSTPQALYEEPSTLIPELGTSPHPIRSQTLGSRPGYLHLSNPLLASDGIQSLSPTPIMSFSSTNGSQKPISILNEEGPSEQKNHVSSQYPSLSPLKKGDQVYRSNNPFAKFL